MKNSRIGDSRRDPGKLPGSVMWVDMCLNHRAVPSFTEPDVSWDQTRHVVGNRSCLCRHSRAVI